MLEDVVDVCVIGGGPAGAVAAIHAARAGHRVCLVEKHSFPREHVGESLSPGVGPLLESLGLIECAERALFVRTSESILCWETDEPSRISSAHAVTLVDRAAFDRELLESAGRAGVVVVRPAVGTIAESLGNWRVDLRGVARGRINSRLIIDASGRTGARRPKRLAVSPPTVAVWASIGVGAPAVTQIEALSDGWLWAAPVGSMQLSVMFVTDPETVRSGIRTGTPGDLLRDRLGRSKLLRPVESGPFTRPVHICDASSSFAVAPMTVGYLLAGEASFTIDPLSATGMEKALQSGVAAGCAANTVLRHPERTALCGRFLEERQREGVQAHSRWASEAYRAVTRYADQPFWKKRGIDPLAQPPPVETVPLERPPAHDVRLRLGPSVRTCHEPCLVDGLIEERLTITSPGLSRPVAFVDGVDIMPLLASLESQPTISGLLNQWSRQVPPSRALRIVRWLWERQILCPAAVDRKGDPGG